MWVKWAAEHMLQTGGHRGFGPLLCILQILREGLMICCCCCSNAAVLVSEQKCVTLHSILVRTVGLT
jgi:hypothetical protein